MEVGSHPHHSKTRGPSSEHHSPKKASGTQEEILPGGATADQETARQHARPGAAGTHDDRQQYPLRTRRSGPRAQCRRHRRLFLLAQKIELIQDIDRNLHLLKRHLPYHESDHVLNIALNLLAGGRRIEHLELRRNDEVYLDALGAKRIPDPTTAGDFCRRFAEADVLTLMDTINEARLRVWAQQPPEFFAEAILEADGSIVPSDRECKQGMDFTYDGQYGYHPLVISLANTAEPLYLFNRSGNRPSAERADVFIDMAVALARRAGFRKILLRGDTKFAQTGHLDRWDEAGDIRFFFGYEAYESLKARADALPADSYRLLKRPPRYPIKTAPREKPEHFRPEIVREPRLQECRAARGDGRGVRLPTARLPQELSPDRPPQAGGGQPGTDAAVRGVSLLLLHHQRP